MILNPACPPTPYCEGGPAPPTRHAKAEQTPKFTGFRTNGTGDRPVGASGQPPAAGQDARRPVRQLATLEVHLDFAVTQVSADQLLGKRIFDVPLDRPPERPRA